MPIMKCAVYSVQFSGMRSLQGFRERRQPLDVFQEDSSSCSRKNRWLKIWVGSSLARTRSWVPSLVPQK